MPQESVIKIIPRVTPPLPRWVNVLFWISLVLFLIEGAGIAFLKIQVSSLSHRKEGLEKAIEVAGTKEEKKLENFVLSQQNKIKLFKELLQEHCYVSKIFDFLKKNCHQKVQFTALEYEYKKEDNQLAVGLEGNALNFRTLGEQILIFSQNKKVQQLEVRKIKLGKEGKVEFSMSLKLNPEILQK